MICAGWAAVVGVMFFRHEFWRDEVRALSLAVDAHSLPHLKALLQNEGHPMLWHVLLYAAHGLTGSKLVLPMLSALICAAAVGLFVYGAPFPLWFKALFVAGLPLYEYSVMARNYGISMLLCFAFARLYPSRGQRPLALGVLLCLLANTNVHSALLAGLLLGFWSWDVLVRARASWSSGPARGLYGGALLFALGIGFALWTVWPTSEMAVSDTSHYTAAFVLESLWKTLLDPGLAFQKIAPRLPGALTLLANLVLVGATLSLLRDPAACVLTWAALVMLSVLFQLVYKGGLRHQGLLVVFMITLQWIVLEQRRHGPRMQVARSLEWLGNHVGFPVLLAALIVTNGYYLIVDMIGEESSSRAFAEQLHREPRYSNAILVGEPDFYMETLRYYADNEVYIPREQRVGHTVNFVRGARKDLSLDTLLREARRLQQDPHRPVLIALGHTKVLDPGGPAPRDPQQLSYSYGRTFSWSADSLAAWQASTKLVRELDRGVHGDERYRVYELVAPPP